MRITYQGAEDARDVPEVGRVDANGVRRGETVDVPAALAGRHPDKRWLDIQLVDLPAASAAGDLDRAAELQVELATLDAGDGLLAQWPNWVHGEAKATKAAKDNGGDK